MFNYLTTYLLVGNLKFSKREKTEFTCHVWDTCYERKKRLLRRLLAVIDLKMGSPTLKGFFGDKVTYRVSTWKSACALSALSVSCSDALPDAVAVTGGLGGCAVTSGLSVTGRHVDLTQPETESVHVTKDCPR